MSCMYFINIRIDKKKEIWNVLFGGMKVCKRKRMYVIDKWVI